jgi:hypothetical protein
MNKELVEIIKNVAEELEGRFTNTYSGRCMYGRQCVGVTTDEPLNFLVAVGWELGRAGLDVGCLNPRSDSMGRSTIVYFPDIEDDGEEDKNCDDCGNPTEDCTC